MRRGILARTAGVAALLVGLLLQGVADAQRIRDLGRIKGVRPQHLTGIGLVIGLNGTGDSQQNILMKKFYHQLVKNMGDVVPFEISDLKTRNTALVVVSATVSSSLKVGSEFEVVVSSIGDAETVTGGYLLAVPLRGPGAAPREDGQAVVEYHAVAQGLIFAEREEGKVRVGKARAVLERPIDTGVFLSNLEDITIILNEPDYGVSSRISAKINEHDLFRDPNAPAHAAALARAIDESTIRVRIPTSYLRGDRVIDFISQIMEIEVPDIDREALVAINRQTGVVVINGAVRVAASALVSYKGAMIRIPEAKSASDDPSAPASPFDRNPLLMDVIHVLKNSNLEFTGNDIVHILRELQKAGAIIGKFVED